MAPWFQVSQNLRKVWEASNSSNHKYGQREVYYIWWKGYEGVFKVSVIGLVYGVKRFLENAFITNSASIMQHGYLHFVSTFQSASLHFEDWNVTISLSKYLVTSNLFDFSNYTTWYGTKFQLFGLFELSISFNTSVRLFIFINSSGRNFKFFRSSYWNDEQVRKFHVTIV